MSSDTQAGVHEGNPGALQKADPGQPDSGIRLVICPGLDLCGAVFCTLLGVATEGSEYSRKICHQKGQDGQRQGDHGLFHRE